jgi:hypothetical protein
MNTQLVTNLSALDGTATPVVAEPAATTGLVTLTATDDYYFVVPRAAEFRTWSIHILTGAAIAGTFTVEACDFPKETDGKNIATVADNNEVTGNWVQINVAAAGYAQGVGTGWTITVLSLVKTAGAAGAVINLVDFASRRLRIKLNCTTGGTVRVVAIGKN